MNKKYPNVISEILILTNTRSGWINNRQKMLIFCLIDKGIDVIITVTGIKFRVFDFIFLGIEFGIVDGIFDDFNAKHFFAMLKITKTKQKLDYTLKMFEIIQITLAKHSPIVPVPQQISSTVVFESTLLILIAKSYNTSADFVLI